MQPGADVASGSDLASPSARRRAPPCHAAAASTSRSLLRVRNRRRAARRFRVATCAPMTLSERPGPHPRPPS